MRRQAYQEMKTNEDHHWWFVARRKIIQKVLNKYVDVSPDNKILEIGCGSGGNLEMLKNYGQLYAMEYDAETRETANQRNICNVVGGSLPDNLPFTEKFDLICILDVIEHIENDKACLTTIDSMLKPGATLLVTVPAYRFLWSAHDVVNHHKRRYTKTSLRTLFNGTDMDVIYSSYFNSMLFPVVALVRLIRNLTGKEEQFDVKMPSRTANFLLTKIFSLERYILPSYALPFGVSLLLVAQKRN